jgi:hypothetical protein
LRCCGLRRERWEEGVEDYLCETCLVLIVVVCG